jgi:hypothetical protein
VAGCMLTCCSGHPTHRTFTRRAAIRTLCSGGKVSSTQLSAFLSRWPRHQPPPVPSGPVVAVAAQLLLTWWLPLLPLLPLLAAVVVVVVAVAARRLLLLLLLPLRLMLAAVVVVLMAAVAASLPAAEVIQTARTKRTMATTTTVCEQRHTEPSSRAPPMPRSSRSARPVSRHDDWSLPVSDTPVIRCTAARFAVGTASLATCPWQRPRSCATPFKQPMEARINPYACHSGPMARQHGHRRSGDW